MRRLGHDGSIPPLRSRWNPPRPDGRRRRRRLDGGPMIDRHSLRFWMVVILVLVCQNAKAETVDIFGDVLVTPTGISNSDFGTGTTTVVHGAVTLSGFTTEDFELDRNPNQECNAYER